MISINFPLGQVVVGLGLMFGRRLSCQDFWDEAIRILPIRWQVQLYNSLLIGAIIILFSNLHKPILTMLGATEAIMPML